MQSVVNSKVEVSTGVLRTTVRSVKNDRTRSREIPDIGYQLLDRGMDNSFVTAVSCSFDILLYRSPFPFVRWNRWRYF